MTTLCSEHAERSVAPCSEHAERSVAVGVGLRPGAAAGDLAALVTAALTAAGVSGDAVATLATLDRRATDPAVQDLARRHGWPVAAYPADALDRVGPPQRADDRTRRAVGTGSVAEAAALLAAGPGATLLVPKTTGRAVTAAVARQDTGHSWTGTFPCICGR
jgi:cobalt-precorrin 5A hydrolase